MCEADVYMVENDREEMIMGSVDVIQPEDNDTWRLINIFGEQKTIRGRIKSMNLVHHRVAFESWEPRSKPARRNDTG